jgi:hypothetical protein
MSEKPIEVEADITAIENALGLKRKQRFWHGEYE